MKIKSVQHEVQLRKNEAESYDLHARTAHRWVKKMQNCGEKKVNQLNEFAQRE